MPRKKKAAPAAAEAVTSIPIPSALSDGLVKGPMSPTEVQAVFQSFRREVLERAMGAEMSHHLGYRKGEARPEYQTITAMAVPARRCSPRKGRCRSSSPGIATACSSRS
jgi:putative transposase